LSTRVSFKDHFSRLAAQYSTFRPTYPQAMFDYLAAQCPVQRAAWDCACGGGQATLALADRFESVTGTDASAEQIANATPHPRVRYRVASADDSGLESASIDLVTVAQALHWLDLDPFYAEVRRVLRDAGVVAVWAYGIVQVEGAGIDQVLYVFYRQTLGPYWPPERRLVEQGYRAMEFPFAELVPPRFAMEVRWELSRFLGYLRTWSATARYVDAVGADPVLAVEKEMAPLWGDPRSPRKISWPLALRVGRKRS
jgi:ubiquinone/menaquinone biosynthesis C-methylase UbiE